MASNIPNPAFSIHELLQKTVSVFKPSINSDGYQECQCIFSVDSIPISCSLMVTVTVREYSFYLI